MAANISTMEELSEYTSNSDKLTVLDFTATWSPPCDFDRLTNQYSRRPNVDFLKVDVSNGHNEVATTYSIGSLPTIIFLRGTTEVNRIFGNNLHELESIVSQLAGTVSSGVSSGQYHTLRVADQGPSNFSSLSHNASNGWTTTLSSIGAILALITLGVAYAIFVVFEEYSSGNTLRKPR